MERELQVLEESYLYIQDIFEDLKNKEKEKKIQEISEL